MTCDKLIVTFNDDSGTIARRRHSPSLPGSAQQNCKPASGLSPVCAFAKGEKAQNRRYIMRRSLLIMTMAAAGLSIAVASDAEARMGVGARPRDTLHATPSLNPSHRLTTPRTLTPRPP